MQGDKLVMQVGALGISRRCKNQDSTMNTDASPGGK